MMQGVPQALQGFLSEHKIGLSLSCIQPGLQLDIAFGNAGGNSRMTSSTWVQMASLSKTVGSAIAIEIFEDRGIALSTPVNTLLQQYGSQFLIESNPDPTWADEVLVLHLMNHSSLTLHYCNGIPTEHGMPSSEDLLSGKCLNFGYPKLTLTKQPGTIFNYSGGGFILLQHLLEIITGSDVETLSRPFLDRNDMRGFSFTQTIPGAHWAIGHRDNEEEIKSVLAFPAFAAGAWGTPRALANFWRNMIHAYNTPGSEAPIRHTTARQMLEKTTDNGSLAFMGAEMGLGVFVMKAGPNRVACHQAANDGFRGVYLICFEGPDAGKGFVVSTNGDNKSVLIVAQTLQYLLRNSDWQGVDPNKLSEHSFDWTGIPQEQIVNLAYKRLVFSAFCA
eukprot:c1301_g1_i1.p1 GENE.c1301_g1_i1~~c1301_g1_i1.p1  ORF type:complete len:402 (-),score=62.55 c1301_g1_i1:86-1255(-)